MLQLSDGQACNPCFLLSSIVKEAGAVLALPTAWKEGGGMGVRWRGEQRERARNECHGELKSLVASPLHWLPRDQQGAKSTQGRKKLRVFREREGRDPE